MQKMMLHLLLCGQVFSLQNLEEKLPSDKSESFQDLSSVKSEKFLEVSENLDKNFAPIFEQLDYIDLDQEQQRNENNQIKKDYELQLTALKSKIDTLLKEQTILQETNYNNEQDFKKKEEAYTNKINQNFCEIECLKRDYNNVREKLYETKNLLQTERKKFEAERHHSKEQNKKQITIIAEQAKNQTGIIHTISGSFYKCVFLIFTGGLVLGAAGLYAFLQAK